MSQTEAFEAIGGRLGFGPKSRASYVALDMGNREPTAAEARILAEDRALIRELVAEVARRD